MKSMPGDKFCITDVGSTTTKGILFRKDQDWRFWYEEVPTTVEKPCEDVTVGVRAVLAALEKSSGEKLLVDGRPAIPYLSTSSAGGGLAMVVTGLVKEITAESAHRVALGAGAIALDVLAMNDGRSPYRKIEDLKTLRPDMVLLAGGFRDGSLTGPVFMAELLLEADLHPKLSREAKLPVIYAGNEAALEYVRKALAERFLLVSVPNIRPQGDHEDLEPARDAIQNVFMDHVMSQAPGYQDLTEWVAAPILPTPAAFARILGLVSKELRTRVLAVDCGGATTDVFSAWDGNVFRTVSANLGMSYSILNVAELGGLRAVQDLLDFPVGETELWNRIGEKHIHPTRLPGTNRDMRIEWALASVAIREAVKDHLVVMRGSSISLGAQELDISDLMRDPPKPMLAREAFALKDYGLIIGSGGILSHSPRAAAGKILTDALNPQDDVELATDSTFMFPHLGVLAEKEPGLAHEMFFKLGIVKLGSAGKARAQGLGSDGGYVPAARSEPGAEPAIVQGEIELVRELAITGQVFVHEGQVVRPDTLVARSTREFLRPFFLNVAQAIGVPGEELPRHMLKQVGDEIGFYEAIANRHRKMMTPKTFHSPVAGRIEKLLPDGVVLVREKPEMAREVTTLHAAQELDLEPKRLEPYVRVKVGDEVERDQWLAAIVKPGMLKLVKSPVRGRVSRVDLKLGDIRIEPLLEEKEVRAWLPGTVSRVTAKGCVIAGHGVTVNGVWGSGGEALGKLRFTDAGNQALFEPGAVTVMGFADADALKQAHAAKVAGLVCAGVNLEDVLAPDLGFTLVVLGGFGHQEFASEVRQVLSAGQGNLALIDGTTQLRVGVRRPKVILPDQGR